MTIHNFTIEYDAINSDNVFRNGDTINGRIILEVSKEIKVQELVFRAQGQARVRWHEQRYYGQYTHFVFTSKEKYYSVSQPILSETRNDGTGVIGSGRHVFPFSFMIPDIKMPSTFKSSAGKIVHKLKAELKQSMQLTKSAKTHFTFVSRADMDIPGLLEPQSGSKDKTISAFGSGTVAIDIRTEKLGYSQGEDLQVTAEIKNQSSRTVKPKFVLYKKKSYFADYQRKVNTTDILKDKCDPVESGSNKTLTKVITVPKELPPSILDCSIIKQEYRLKIELDIKAASNPEVKLPIVVLPQQNDTAVVQKALEAFAQNNHHEVQTYPLVQIFDQPSQGSDDPPPYEAHATYPTTNTDQK